MKPLKQACLDFERAYIAEALATYGTVAEAARQLGENRTHFHFRMRRHGLRSPRPYRVYR